VETSTLKDDLVAGVVVYLVALPLCLGIALASGAPLLAGVLSGIVGGIVVTLASRCRLGVSGPAAGLAVVVAEAVGRLGYDTFLLAVVVAGVAQVAAGYLRWGIIGHYFPSAVIKGMLTGIGIIMVLKQIPHAFGYDPSWMGEMEFLQADGHSTLSELYYMLRNLRPGAILIASLSLGTLVFWETSWVKSRPALSSVPAPLLVVVLGTLTNAAYASLAPSFLLSGDELVQLPLTDSIAEFRASLDLPDFSQLGNPDVYATGLTLALIASLETLLCVEATDKLDPQKQVTPTNRELKAQGLGNLLAGLIGGLPITQVVVRSAANIQAGGKTRVASLFHGVLLLTSVLLVPGLLNHIPLSCLAAILIVTGYKLARVSLFREMLSAGHWQYVPFLVTVLGLVFTDMLTGIAMGMAIGIFNVLMQNYRTNYMIEQSDDGSYVVRLSEHVSFLNKAAIVRGLREVPGGSRVTIDGSRSVAIDDDVLEVLRDFSIRAEQEAIELDMLGVSGLDKLPSAVGH